MRRSSYFLIVLFVISSCSKGDDGGGTSTPPVTSTPTPPAVPNPGKSSLTSPSNNEICYEGQDTTGQQSNVSFQWAASTLKQIISISFKRLTDFHSYFYCFKASTIHLLFTLIYSSPQDLFGSNLAMGQVMFGDGYQARLEEINNFQPFLFLSLLSNEL